ncbi:hypothetical protein JCM16303_003239 [Sporobolomyces ruberrimus]
MTSIDEGGVLSRTSILALYSSPLVPNKLEGMKELSEWYGEYSTPPSPPIQRSQLSSTSRQNSSSVVPQSTTTGGRDGGGGGNHRRLTPFNSDSNPFANFGRFGVDGGLMGEPLEMPRRRGGGGKSTGGEDGGKDLAPHLQQISGGGSPAMSNRKTKEDGTTSGALPWSTSGDSKRDSFLKEERNNRSGLTSTRGNTGNGEIEPRRRGGGLGNGVESSSTSAKDRRGLGPADEGGWRSVGTTREEREKRLLRNQANSTGATDSPRRFDRERRDNHERGGGDRDRDRDRSEREPYSSRGGRGGPAWMTDEDSNSTAPTWMDSSARKDGLETSGGGGGGAIAEDEAILDVGTPSKKGADWQASSGPGGMDSIQQWKMQMKEMERKERERDLKDAGIEVPTQAQEERHEPESVFSALTSPKPEPASTKSIFEDLGIVRSPAVTPAAPPGLTAPPGLQGPNPEQAAGAGPGGRASRFAKFFDGKPQSPVTQAQQPPPSVFGALMGGGPTAPTNSASPGPSKEDAESMARLMGMLQVQGTRTESPIARQQAPVEPTPSGYTSPAPHPEPAAPIPQSQPPAAEESRSSSRFKFSSSTARTASPSIGTRSVPASQPQSAVHSPTASNQSIPPPPAPPGFGGYPAGPPPSQSRAPLNHLPAALSPADRMRSPPLPLPQSQQQQQNYNNRSRTVSTASELGSRPPSSNHLNHLPASSPLPLPLSMTHQQPQQAQQHHVNQNNSGPLPPSAFPPQFYNGQRIPPPGPHGLSMGMYPPGANGQIPPPPPPQSMMNPEILRNLAAAAAGNGMRSPPLPGHSHPTSLPPQQQGPGMSYGGPPLPLHGAMVPPHQGLPPPRGQQQMMFAPPPHPSQYPPPGGRPGMQGPGIGMSMGGNAGADLMALLNSGGNGGIRIGGQGPPPHPHQQQGNLPPFLMEGR